MALETYHRKRDFTRTAEPKGGGARAAPGQAFVIQKHAARRLHYDLRLELDGVLKSWAVTRGPSLVPGEKRLAVEVEDHPLEYGDFEGTIPQGEYGGGTVVLWDRGRWEPVGDPHRGLKKGHLEFAVEGEKLSGRWHLVRLKGRAREKRTNWLLIKAEDEAARGESDPDILEERPESVKTGRVVEEVAGEAPGWSSKKGGALKTRKPAGKATKAAEAAPETAGSKTELARLKGARRAPLPDFLEPALATLVAKVPTGKRWLHEIKFDGYRLQARIADSKAQLLTRSGLDWTDRFGGELVEALAALPVKEALIDGELVVENGAGASDFSLLQAALSEGRTEEFRFYVFDVMFLDGYDITEVPLHRRKEILGRLVDDGNDGLIRFSGHFDENGELILKHACRLSLEGVVSKLRDGPYLAGRGKDWVKSKCTARQEFVVAGYVPSTTAKAAIGSLVLGYHDDGKLMHAGRVGTGYTAAVASDLYRRLKPLEVKERPFAEKLTTDQARGVRFVKPELVAEIEFRGWTADNSLRHASFRGLREDKAPSEIVRERAPGTEVEPRPKKPALTHPDRIYWPKDGVTKAGLADHYATVWRRIAPFITGRPLSLLRCPGGIGPSCFFQKHAWKGLSKAIRLVDDPLDSSDEPIIAIDDLDGLMGLVQGGVLEIHPWGSTLAALEQPDQIIMDLDPGEGVSWESVIAAALEVRERLDALGLTSFVKTSGGKGLHVVAPLKPDAGWDTVKGFTRDIANAMASDTPERFVATVTKSKRRGKILVDYLRNGRGATAVAPYSTRARDGAAVSMPLAWDELSPSVGPAYFTVANTPARLDAVEDPWAGFRKAAAPLPGSATKAPAKKRRR